MVDDATLIRRVLAGDRHAFQWLIRANERLVYSVVWKIVQNKQDTEDICQDVFLKVYQKLPTFKFESQLSTWIARIAYNEALGKLRKRDILAQAADADEEHFQERFVELAATPAEELEARETKEVLQRAIEQLPVHYRTLLTMYHLEELSYDEMTEVSGLPLGTVKNYLYRARHLLKELLQKNHALTERYGKRTEANQARS
ncbi:RNA polymerase sigma factor [Rhabdobacter roseus]|uniref:RNA polymerase sigma-70 factor (ECF subfamily) n=1 Tax=Rhabdobacter roseus TaxID=1655419 RepID=A0A840TP30_9BACT|nr:sigma-70 family RNA polymerase sigma factor [Rhabdobacter roseus]MBB5286056.1 RNA polymerase sigma-70 factor (ECF subfamily) [Rhabdobacter roseus]